MIPVIIPPRITIRNQCNGDHAVLQPNDILRLPLRQLPFPPYLTLPSLLLHNHLKTLHRKRYQHVLPPSYRINRAEWAFFSMENEMSYIKTCIVYQAFVWRCIWPFCTLHYLFFLAQIITISLVHMTYITAVYFRIAYHRRMKRNIAPLIVITYLLLCRWVQNRLFRCALFVSGATRTAALMVATEPNPARCTCENRQGPLHA